MKKLLPIFMLVIILCSVIAVSAIEPDYYVYDATDLIGKISANNLSISHSYILSDPSLYLRVNTTKDGTGTDSTQIEIKMSDIATDFYIKDYPVMKMGYRSNIADTDARIDLNIGLDYAGKATRVWGITTNYDRTGADSAYVIDISSKANGGEGITGYSWSNVDADSYVNYIRFKPYYNQQTMKAGEYFDIEYVAFFKDVASANAFNYNFDVDKAEYTDVYLTEQVRRAVVGNKITLNVACSPSFKDAPKATFKSNDTSIATVDSNGVITCLKAGTTTVTATYGNFTSTCKVYVLAEKIKPVDFVSRDSATGVTEVKTTHLGDSITTYAPNPNGGWNYHDWWGKWYYIDNEDKGISGATLSATGANQFVYRYDQMRADADLITVKGGTNDFSRTFSGTYEDRSDTTYMGAIRVLMEGLIERYPDKQIVFFTPIRRCESAQTVDTKNVYGDTLRGFAKAMETIGAAYDIPVINLYEPEVLDFTSPVITYPGFDENEVWHDGKCESDLMPDGLHPSGKGHIIMANYMVSEMTRLGVINAPICGDVNSNGKVDIIDLITLSRKLANWAGYDDSAINKNNSDVNADGNVGVDDVTILARHIANWAGYDSLPKSN